MDIMPDPCQLLHTESSPSLAAWYATPLTQAQAQALQAQARQMLQRMLAHGESTLAPRVAEMIAGYWQGKSTIHDHRSLIATLPEAQQAFVELVYGQLLVSCKRAGAMQHLDRGFELATPSLAAPAYFILLRRHALLRNLVLTTVGNPPQTLPDLLQEARVIQRLQPTGGWPRNLRNPHDDTLG